MLQRTERRARGIHGTQDRERKSDFLECLKNQRENRQAAMHEGVISPCHELQLPLCYNGLTLEHHTGPQARLPT